MTTFDLPTALYLADKLDRPDCKTAAHIVKREIANDALRNEQPPRMAEAWACCLLVMKAAGVVAGVLLIGWVLQ
jgi:hypothetical protein